MKTQTSKSQIYCPMAAIRYARVLYEVGVPKEAVQKTREIFEEVPQLHEIFANPTIELQKKMNVVDRVFPKEIRNFLKVACRYQRMDLIEDIFTAYDRYCDEQNQVLNAVLTCIQPPTEEQKKGMEAFLCKKYGAKSAKIEVRQDKRIYSQNISRRQDKVHSVRTQRNRKKEWRRSFARNMAQIVLKSKFARTKHCLEDLFSGLAVMSMTGV